VPPLGREERLSGRSKNYIFPESLVCNLVCKPIRMSSINKNSREPRLQCRLKFVWTTFTKKAISRVLGLELEQALRRWKANSKMYKVMFHEVQLLPMFTRSKRTIKRSRQNSSSAISSGRDCRQACVKNTFWTCFVAPSRRHMFPSERRLPVTILNELKLLPRSRDDGAIINTLL
jgi:hypothetical protein